MLIWQDELSCQADLPNLCVDMSQTCAFLTINTLPSISNEVIPCHSHLQTEMYFLSLESVKKVDTVMCRNSKNYKCFSKARINSHSKKLFAPLLILPFRIPRATSVPLGKGTKFALHHGKMSTTKRRAIQILHISTFMYTYKNVDITILYPNAQTLAVYM